MARTRRAQSVDTGRAVMVSLLLGLACGSAAGQEAPLGFVFDDGFRSSGCLSFEFSRPWPTVDSRGSWVDAGVARASGVESIAGAPDFEFLRKINGMMHIYGSGVARDGLTPMFVMYDGPGGYLDVFTVADDDLLLAEQSGAGRNRTLLDPEVPDMMHGTVSGKRYPPAAAVVCHGVVVVFTTVQVPDGYGGWRDSSVAFLTSRDEGQSWDLIYEDSAIQTGKNRSREWSMQNWWPVTQGPGPTEAFIAAADYRGNPGAVGGRVYMFRMTRPDAGSEWKIQAPRRVYEHAGVPGEHFHTAAVVPLPDGGLRALVAVGDSQDINRIVGLTRPDHAYAGPGWVVTEDYHGTLGDPGTTGNQFVGVAPGPRLGDVLAGSDLNDEQIMLLDADGPGPHAQTSWVYGRSWADGRRPANFTIYTPHPELGTGPYVCKYDPYAANQDGLVMPRRALYSPDGVRWTQALASGSGANWTVGIHGGHIYFSRSAEAGAGLWRTPAPAVVTRRGLMIGPGGVQRLVPEPAAPSGDIVPLVRSPEGLWLDDGVPLDPQPPCAGPVFRCWGSVDNPSSRIGDIKVVGAAADVGDVLGTDEVQVRAWVKNLRANNSLRTKLEFGGGEAPVAQGTNLSSTDAWMSLNLTGRTPIAPGANAKLVVRSGSAPDDADFYLALDTVGEGVGYPGYPMMPDMTDPPVGVAMQDELAAVGGFQCGNRWTITLAGMLPQDGWDQSLVDVGEWPLCTLWGDSDNYIGLVADTADGRLVARVVRDGVLAGTLTSEELFWLRGSSVLVSLADDGAGVRMTLSAAGLTVQEAQADHAASPAVAPSRVMFGDSTGQSGGGAAIRVSPMVWFGGRIDQVAALEAATRAQLLTSLSFLDAPTERSADLDGDGQRTIFDFLVFQNLFLTGDLKADFDGNGSLELFDYLGFQNAFVSPCG